LTAITVGFVDTYALRGSRERLEILTLRRAPRVTRAGSWETVHGTIEPGETPVQASVRELREETGFAPERFYNLSRTDAFYLHTSDELMMIPVFAAFVAAGAEPRLSAEHDGAAWLPAVEAARRFAWPRERRAVEDILSILGSGDAGLLDAVLRVS
jgi:8-oxo-dGTP pyrophosphatase MutT (NUDIX family)